MHRDRVVQQFGETPLEIARVVLVIDVVSHIPVAPDPNLPALDGQSMSRHQLLDAAEQRCLAERVLKRQILGERRRFGVDLGQERQQRLRFRGEHEQVADDGVVERFDAEAVARAEQRLPPLVPDRERKHAAQLIEAVAAVAVIGGEDRLGVGGRAEIPAMPEQLAQFDVVVDLAIIGDRRWPRCEHRLLRGIAQVDDREAAMDKSGNTRRAGPSAAAIRPAMRDQPVQCREPRIEPRDRPAVERNDTCYAAHQLTSRQAETEKTRPHIPRLMMRHSEKSTGRRPSIISAT